MIREFALKKPVYRIIANTQTSMGATGYTTGLAPSMSLGCGAYAGNITSDNITPLHLINIKRLAYELPRTAGAGAAGEGDLRTRVAAFVESRVGAQPASGLAAPRPVQVPPPSAPTETLDFVCEDDVRRALREGRGPAGVRTSGHRTPVGAGPAAAGKDVLAVDRSPATGARVTIALPGSTPGGVVWGAWGRSWCSACRR